MTAEKVTKQVKSPVTNKSVNQTKETLIYCGPTIKNVVVSGEAFNNGLPKKLEKLLENKAIKRLIVPIDRIVDTKKNIKKNGTIENLSYKQIETMEVK